jgi:hypothetical protein
MVSKFSFFSIIFDLDLSSRGGFQFVRYLNRNKYDVTLVSFNLIYHTEKVMMIINRKIIRNKLRKWQT